MISTAPPQVPAPLVEDFCRKWKIEELAVFGSALREDFRPDSDLDLAVTFAKDAKWSLLDRSRMVAELTALFGRTVDIVEIPVLRNPFRRREILSTRKIIYAA